MRFRKYNQRLDKIRRSIRVRNASSGFNPLTLSPDLWLDASDTSTITHSTGDVSQIDDKSGNNFHFTQGNATYQPRTGDSTQNDLNILDFASDFLISGDLDGTALDLNEAHTYFVVAKVNTGQVINSRRAINWGAVRFQPQSNMWEGYFEESGGTESKFQGGTSNTSFHIFEAHNSSGNNSEFLVDNVSIGTGGVGPTYDAGSMWIWIGAGTGNPPTAGSGTISICEVLLWGSQLSSGDRDEVRTYLEDKWGLSLPLTLGPIVYFDMSITSAITHAGGAVSQVDDLSVNSNDATQGTGADQPETNITKLKGRNVVDFDGTEWLDLGNVAELGGLTAFTFFAVVKSADVVSINQVFSNWQPTGGDRSFVVGIESSDVRVLLSSDGSTSHQQDSTDAAFVNNTWYLIAVEYDGSEATHTDRVKIWVNGALKAVTTTGTLPASLYDAITEDVNIGSVESGGGDELDGSIAALAMYDSAFSDADRQSVELYLLDRWGWTVPLKFMPVLWLDMSDTDTITESGGDVSQIDDKSGYGNHAAQGVGANQPGTGNNTLNGLNVLDFDGNDYLDIPYSSEINPTSFTVFIVISVTVVGAHRGAFSTMIDGAVGGGFSVNVGTDNGGLGFLLSDGSANSFEYVTGGTIATASQWYLVSGDFSPGDGGVWLDGVLLDTTTLADIDYDTTTSVRIGARYTDSTLYIFTGNIAEIVLFDRVLSDTDRQEIETYLQNKWGL